jgi:hyperosmotically inducible protein
MTKTTRTRWLTGLVLIGAMGAGSWAAADKAPRTNRDENLPANNTGKNDADRSRQGEKPTADQSKNDKSDLELTKKIRRAVVADKDLSMAAHNVKIIVESGVVTLKGPVKTDAERTSIEKKASDFAGSENVRNELEVEKNK